MEGKEAEVPGDDLLDYGVAVLDSAPARREPQVLVERLIRVVGVVEQRVGRLKVIIIIIIIITIIIIIITSRSSVPTMEYVYFLAVRNP